MGPFIVFEDSDVSPHVLKQHHGYGDLSNLGSKSYQELVPDITDKQRRQNVIQAMTLVGRS